MPQGDNVKHITKKEWESEGEALFGDNMMDWKFVCPNCGNIQSPEDFKKFKYKGAKPSDAYFRCIGRLIDDYEGRCSGAASNRLYSSLRVHFFTALPGKEKELICLY